MTDEDIGQGAGGRPSRRPMTAGEIVIGYNVAGSPKALKLPRDVYARHLPR